MTLDDKRKYLKEQGINIRQNIGEAVPTVIFHQIANKISMLTNILYDEAKVMDIIKSNALDNINTMISFIRKNKKMGFVNLSKIAEYANVMREDNEAFYTRQDICYTVIKNLPDASNFKSLHILEPSVGVGNFLPFIFKIIPIGSVVFR